MTTSATTGDLATSLVLRHQKLAIQNIEGTVTAGDRAGLVEDLIAAGAATPPGALRDALRDILYFWAGDQASCGERKRDAPPPALAPFVDKPAPPSTSPAPVAPSPPSPTPDGGPMGAAASTPTGTLSGVSGVIGALRNLAKRTAAPVSDASKEVPVTPTTDIEKEARARAILRIAALARQWRVTGDPDAKHGYLLDGKALTEASLYADEDPDIGAFVAASQEKANAAQRLRRRLWIVLALFVLSFVGMGFYSIQLKLQASREEAAAATRENRELQQANAASTREKEQFQSRVRTAVDALAHNDLDPLKSLLQRFGDADPKQLERLQITQPTPSSIEATSAKTPIQNVNIQAITQRPAATEAACSGFLWFGSTDDSRLSDHRDPSLLKAGDTVTLDNRADIRMRSDWPASDTYAMSPQNGLVPAGSTVKLAGAPRAYSRSANQIWAPVTVPRAMCTTVFLQYVGNTDKRDAALAALRAIAVQTPPAEQITSAKGLAEVRYFWPEDKAVADQVAAALGSFTPDDKLKVVPLTDFPTKPSSGTIEVWLDLNS